MGSKEVYHMNVKINLFKCSESELLVFENVSKNNNRFIFMAVGAIHSWRSIARKCILKSRFQFKFLIWGQFSKIQKMPNKNKSRSTRPASQNLIYELKIFLIIFTMLQMFLYANVCFCLFYFSEAYFSPQIFFSAMFHMHNIDAIHL